MGFDNNILGPRHVSTKSLGVAQMARARHTQCHPWERSRTKHKGCMIKYAR